MSMNFDIFLGEKFTFLPLYREKAACTEQAAWFVFCLFSLFKPDLENGLHRFPQLMADVVGIYLRGYRGYEPFEPRVAESEVR